jgi:hypothetical protein
VLLSAMAIDAFGPLGLYNPARPAALRPFRCDAFALKT